MRLIAWSLVAPLPSLAPLAKPHKPACHVSGASAGSPPIQDGASAIGLLPVAQPETRLAARNRIMSPGFI